MLGDVRCLLCCVHTTKVKFKVTFVYMFCRKNHEMEQIGLFFRNSTFDVGRSDVICIVVYFVGV